MAAVIPVTLDSDLFVARRAAKEMATALGFDARASEEIAVAVSETRGQSGQACPRWRTDTDAGRRRRAGIRIEARDRGPGIADVERAMTDGFSTAGSLGYGLGAVNRLMDQCDIRSRQGAHAGTIIVCTRWLRPQAPIVSPCPLEFGAATRACSAMTVNGDAFVIKRWQASALVGGIAGLGHGPPAYRAAQTARHYVETHCDQPLEAIFRGVGRTCRATRGVVMALARFEFGGPGIRFSFASVGNIEACLCGGPVREHFIVRRGILGGQAPPPRVTDHRWQAGQVLVLHSDGLTHRWRWDDFPNLARESATTVAQHLLRALAHKNDDATVVVVRSTTGE